VNLTQFETACANELGLSVTNEKTTIDDAINVAVQRVLEDTHCYVKETDYTGWDGTSQNYTLDSAILEIVEVQLSSSGVTYPLERLSIIDLLERRRQGQTSGSPVRYYAMSGANLLMFYPAPGTGDTLVVYVVPVPTALSGSTDDPSSTTYGGIPRSCTAPSSTSRARSSPATTTTRRRRRASGIATGTTRRSRATARSCASAEARGTPAPS
jgi:hypothetical protein